MSLDPVRVLDALEKSHEFALPPSLVEGELEIDEINTGIFCFRRSLLAPALRLVHPDNAQGEYYLTDVVEVLAEAGFSAPEIDEMLADGAAVAATDVGES